MSSPFLDLRGDPILQEHVLGSGASAIVLLQMALPSNPLYDTDESITCSAGPYASLPSRFGLHDSVIVKYTHGQSATQLLCHKCYDFVLLDQKSDLKHLNKG